MTFSQVLDKLKNEREGWSGLLVAIGIFILMMVLGNVVAALLIIVIGGFDISQMANMSGALAESENGWLALTVSQGVASLLIFVFSAWFYWKVVEGKSLSEFNFKGFPAWSVVGFLILIQAAFLPFNGWLQSVNENMQLPASLKDLEDVLKAMEDSAAQMTELMTDINSPGRFILAFIVIAVIAGVGEELVFRGLIQRKLYLISKNQHVAIWIAAFIFSAIHFQFYGFLPRLMLGAMFGYFYYFTGNIWVPIIAHVFNNGLAIVMLYLVNQEVISPEIEKMDTVPVSAAILSLLLAVGGFYYVSQKKLS